MVLIYPVADVDEAVEKANDTDHGSTPCLGRLHPRRPEDRRPAAVDGERRRGVRVRLGQLLSAPMGGWAFGVGRRHGPEGLLKYTESQTIATARVFNSIRPSASRPQSGRSHCYPSCAL